MIERLEAKGAFFRSLQDPIDTAFLPAIVAGIKGADPDITLQAICNQLESMRERTPRGRTSWQPSSMMMQLEWAQKLALLKPAQ